MIHIFQKIREVFTHYFSKGPFSLPHPHFSFPSEFCMIRVCEFGDVPQDPKAVCLSLLFFLLFLSLFPLLSFPAEPLCGMVPTTGFSCTISIGCFITFLGLLLFHIRLHIVRISFHSVHCFL